MTDEPENGVPTLIAFICECGDPTCRRTIELTLDDYLRRRPDPVLHAEHEILPASPSSPSNRSR